MAPESFFLFELIRIDSDRFGRGLGAEADHYLTAIMKQQVKSIRIRSKSPADLTGMRFGKWTVLKYAGRRYSGGQRFSTQMWLCRCDCGVQKEVAHYNLTGGQSTKCQQCQYVRHGIFSTKLHRAWKNLKQSGQLPKEWQDFDAFRKDVGDPPDKTACLKRLDRSKPHSAENTLWLYPGSSRLFKQSRQKSTEERIQHEEKLRRIRSAKSLVERNRLMIAARKAGYTLQMIGIAANVTTERVRVIVRGQWFRLTHGKDKQRIF